MGCGCKGDNNFEIPGAKEAHEPKIGLDVNTIVKWVVFIIVTILSPILAPPILIWALYKGVIQNERLDAILMFRAIARAANDILEEEDDSLDDDEIDRLDELEVVEMDADIMDLIRTAPVEELHKNG